MPNSKNSSRYGILAYARTAGFAIALLALSGCGGFDGVELKGKVFDVIGVNGDQNGKTPKMQQRAGLVTPPSLERLPNPDEKPAGGGDVLATIADPDRIEVEVPEELARRQAAYCKEHYDPAVLRGDDLAVNIEGPAGPCRRSVLTAIEKINSSDQ